MTYKSAAQAINYNNNLGFCIQKMTRPYRCVLMHTPHTQILSCIQKVFQTNIQPAANPSQKRWMSGSWEKGWQERGNAEWEVRVSVRRGKSEGSRLFQSNRLITLSWPPHTVTAGTGLLCAGRSGQAFDWDSTQSWNTVRWRRDRKKKSWNPYHRTQQIVSLLCPPPYIHTTEHWASQCDKPGWTSPFMCLLKLW